MLWEKLKVEHATKMRKVAIDMHYRTDPLVEEWAVVNINTGPAYTVSHHGVMMGIAGIRIVRPGIGHSWAVFSVEMYKHVRRCFGTVKEAFLILEEEYVLRRVRTLSRVDFPASQRFVEHLNFKRKRLIPSIGHYLYVRKTWEF